MDNEKYWDSLFRKLDNMSEDDFLNLVRELESEADVPFAIGEYDEVALSFDLADAGSYCAMSVYDNQSQYNIFVSEDMEMAA